MKTVSCPSCGASATNHQNCEFCGSLFVRYEIAGLNPNEIFTNNSFMGFSFPGLSDNLRVNLASQSSNSFIITDVMKDNEVLLQIVQSSAIADLLPGGSYSFPGIAVHVPFGPATKSLVPKFKSMAEHKLFSVSISDDIIDCAIDYGNDSEGAAYLSSRILQTVYNCLPSDNLTYKTSNYNEETSASKEGGRCFIATATMGDYDHPDVLRLRRFRDMWILKQNWGEDFVKWYYKHGEKPAEVIKNNVFLKVLSYLLIVKPILLISRLFRK